MSGIGPLAIGASADTVVAIQIFLVMTAVPMMLIAGLLEQNRARHLALVEVERQKSAILGAHPDLMFLQTRDGVYLHYYAKNVADLLVDPEAFLGKTMRDVLPPGLAEAFTHAFETATLEEAVVIDYPLPMNGTLQHYEARIIGVDGDRVLTVVRDITERWQWESALREAQQRYALATAVGGIGVWDFDVQTRTVCVEGALHASAGISQRRDWRASHRLGAPDLRGRPRRCASAADVMHGGLRTERRRRVPHDSQGWLSAVVRQYWRGGRAR